MISREIFFQHEKRNFVSPRDHLPSSISSLFGDFTIVAVSVFYSGISGKLTAA